MGVGIDIFNLAQDGDPELIQDVKKEIDAINGVLRQAGIDTFTEPEKIPGCIKTSEQFLSASIPYSWLHRLRRAIALQRFHSNDDDSKKYMLGADIDDAKVEELVLDETSIFECHAICHSDCEGYYVPVKFPGNEVLFPPASTGLPSPIGSSVSLLSELDAVAPSLGIQISPEGTFGDTGDKEKGTINDGVNVAIQALRVLYPIVRHSVKYGSAIRFN